VLTQMAITCRNAFSVPITFRQLNDELSTPNLLANHLDENLPANRFAPVAAVVSMSPNIPPVQNTIAQHVVAPNQTSNVATYSNTTSAIDLIAQQLQLLGKQLEIIQGNNPVSTI